MQGSDPLATNILKISFNLKKQLIIPKFNYSKKTIHF